MRHRTGLVALTGASGFVGRALIGPLLAQGWHVRALQHRQPLPAHPHLGIVTGSLNHAATREALVAGADAVLHIGGLVLAKRESDFFTANAEATGLLAQAAQKAGVARLLYVSSLAARAPHLSAYAASKRAGEQALAAIPGLAWDIMRPAAVYGAGDANSRPLVAMLQRGKLWLPVRPDARLALLHVDDLAAAMLAWLACPALPAGRCFELADGPGYRWQQMAEAAGQVLKRPVKLVPIPLRLALGLAWAAEMAARVHGGASFISRGKMREIAHADWSADPQPFSMATGWQPCVDLIGGLQKMLGSINEASAA